MRHRLYTGTDFTCIEIGQLKNMGMAPWGRVSGRSAGQPDAGSMRPYESRSRWPAPNSHQCGEETRVRLADLTASGSLGQGIWMFPFLYDGPQKTSAVDW